MCRTRPTNRSVGLDLSTRRRIWNINRLKAWCQTNVGRFSSLRQMWRCIRSIAAGGAQFPAEKLAATLDVLLRTPPVPLEYIGFILGPIPLIRSSLRLFEMQNHTHSRLPRSTLEVASVGACTIVWLVSGSGSQIRLLVSYQMSCCKTWAADPKVSS